MTLLHRSTAKYGTGQSLDANSVAFADGQCLPGTERERHNTHRHCTLQSHDGDHRADREPIRPPVIQELRAARVYR